MIFKKNNELLADLILEKEKLILTRRNSSSARPEPVYEGTPTDYCKDQVVSYEGVMPSLWG